MLPLQQNSPSFLRLGKVWGVEDLECHRNAVEWVVYWDVSKLLKFEIIPGTMILGYVFAFLVYRLCLYGYYTILFISRELEIS